MINKAWLFLLSILFVTGCGAPSINVIRHNEQMAAVEAEKFAQMAFVQHDPQGAYGLFSDEGKKYLSLGQFVDTIKQIHPTGYPGKLSAVEFEPMLGQRSMNIFLRGQGENEDFYYRLVMQGTSDTGYKVSGFLRGNGPPPASSLRKPLVQSTPDNASP